MAKIKELTDKDFDKMEYAEKLIEKVSDSNPQASAAFVFKEQLGILIFGHIEIQDMFDYLLTKED